MLPRRHSWADVWVAGQSRLQKEKNYLSSKLGHHSPRAHLLAYPHQELVYVQHLLFLARTAYPQRQRVGVCFSLANDGHVRDLLDLALSNPIIQRLPRSSTCTRMPAALSRCAMPCAAGACASEIGMTLTCSGASHTGNAPAKCSMRLPMKRSSVP